MTDKDLCTESEINKFLNIKNKNKVFITSNSKYSKRDNVLYLPSFEGKGEVGNIFRDYHTLLWRFDLMKLVINEKK